MKLFLLADDVHDAVRNANTLIERFLKNAQTQNLDNCQTTLQEMSMDLDAVVRNAKLLKEKIDWSK